MREHAKRIARDLLAKLERNEVAQIGRDEVEAAVDKAWPTLGLSKLDKDVFRHRVYHFVVVGASSI